MSTTNIILINEQHLGTEATAQDAHTMIRILTARGYDVAYGDKIRHDDDENANAIPDAVWSECLTQAIRTTDIIANAQNITVLNDGQFCYAVLTAELETWTGANGPITARNYETFCDQVPYIGREIAMPGHATMIALCEALIEAGAASKRLG